MKIHPILLSLATAAMLATPAAAQDSQDGVYEGTSFTLTPPAKWLLISGSLTEADRAKLPENIRDHYRGRNSDIIFMDIDSLDGEAKKGFKNNLNIVSINEAIPITDDLVKELSTILEQQYDSMFAQSFKMESTKTIDLDNIEGKVFYLSGTYTVQDYSVKLEQILVPGKNESFVLTCSYETGKPNTEETASKCNEAFKSLKLK